MSRLVRPETDILTLSGGDTLIVKRRLNFGETAQVYEASSILNGDGTRHLDQVKAAKASLLAHLLDWAGPGFTDFEGRPLVIRDQPPALVEGILNQLSEESMLEILHAVTEHANRQRAARLEEKKTQTGGG